MELCAAVLLFYILQYTSSQPDSFIRIDCGIPENSSYQDLTSSIIYVSDHGFISSGENHNISADYIKPSLAQRYYNVRFFPDGTRNCYTLRSLVAGNKYFVRAAFYYGNYDGLNMLPVFDLYLGTNRWHEVQFSDAGATNWMDIIVVAPADYLQVCLVNKGMETPFISGMDLRPLKSNLYPEANSSQPLVLINSNRFNIGLTDDSIVRYPLDPHDRIWSTFDTIPSWKETSATYAVRNYLTDAYDVPSAIMQNAATPANGSRIDFSWNPSDPSVNISSRYFFVFYFSELLSVASNELRQFDIIVDNRWNTKPYTPPYQFAESFSGTVQGQAGHSVSLVATKNAKLPPILNAMVKPISETATNPGDARTMMAIQETFGVSKNWIGDPCAPKAFAWEGLNCTYPPVGLPRITALDLSHNNLSGSIPNYLGQLPLLVFLFGNNENLCGNGLEYLHVACKPALIHRDVKSRNILLTTDLGAKIADFGLTEAFSDLKTHITTEPAAPPPTGHNCVVPINDSVSIHIGEWVHQNLDQGSIESIIDSSMGGDYDVNSVWKVADLALHCKEEISRERPTMTDVVAQIKESVELEARRDMKRNSAVVASDDLSYADTLKTSADELDYWRAGGPGVPRIRCSAGVRGNAAASAHRRSRWLSPAPQKASDEMLPGEPWEVSVSWAPEAMRADVHGPDAASARAWGVRRATAAGPACARRRRRLVECAPTCALRTD
ncbi:hypothetical protein SETIT_1G087000v2 [Setaria italica]|uniref:Protein kinase domain-containing protein n=1 Tax=Setaria italica TaxID=4555 RepID=A0A368PIH6_SETIT|nr:hypothetical protein SETIT_1G087000v2 [Setaria italica]